MKIFLSQSGKTSHAVATALKHWLNNLLPSLDLWISDDLPSGRRWSIDLAEKLYETDFGIAILTKESLGSSWIYFECGALSKTTHGSRIFPYLFDLEDTDFTNNPLTQFQARIADKAGTKKLVFDLNNSLPTKLPEQSLNSHFEGIWSHLENEFNSIREKTSGINEIIKGKAQFDTLFAEVTRANSLLENQYLRIVVNNSLEDFAGGIGSVNSSEKSYSLPYILYPVYLINLLKSLKPQTQAIAIVDKDEPFWRQKEGKEILLHTHKKSTRVFAFRNKSHLRENLPIIQEHAHEYDVFIIDSDLLTQFYSSKPYDFSIIGDINSTSLLAVYDEEDSLMKKIKFTAETSNISRHHDKFAQIRDAAILVKKNFNAAKEGEELISQVFPPLRPTSTVNLSPLEQRHIEMSSYIHPQEYHLHEERHAYYVEMMDRMIEICESHPLSVRNQQEKLKALELGAGTGLFTKRLLMMQNIDLTAIELDWACYHILLENMMEIVDMKKSFSERAPDIIENDATQQAIEGKARLKDVFTSEQLNSIVRCINADSRIYNPDGTFSFIFSSFADHHIKPYDKAEYFENIKRNLKENGLVIIGDEFLPSYDENSRERALNTYHRHIINETKKIHGNDAWGLVQLEEAALESGLKGIGDFKLSCELYEGYLSKAGFKYTKELIGPKDRDDVGGIYVYVLSL
ncbi:MAG TPA: methyltransferase domain-containing protein [Pyrinomonadaceae bacterium]|jgi:SAM-dependent methyltransferase